MNPLQLLTDENLMTKTGWCFEKITFKKMHKDQAVAW